MENIKNKVILIWIVLALVILLIYIAIIPNTVKNIAINSIECYEDGILLSWNNEDSNNFCIYRKDNNEKWIYIAKCGGNNYYDKNVVANNTYTYAIQCVDSNNNKLSKRIKGEKDIYYCSIPEITSYNVDGAINIRWNQVDGAEGYEILRQSDDDEWKVIATVDSAKYEYIDTDIVVSTKYKYAIRLQGEENKNRFISKGVEVLVADVPTNISLRCATDSIIVGWDEVPGVKRYCVMRKKNLDDNWEIIANVQGATKFRDYDVKIGDDCYYTVRCMDEIQDLYISNFDEVGKNIYICESPVLKNIYIEDDKIIISWNDVYRAGKYRIYIKIDSEDKYKGIDTVDNDVLSYVYSDLEHNHKYTFTVRCISEDEAMLTSMYDSDGISIDY